VNISPHGGIRRLAEPTQPGKDARATSRRGFLRALTGLGALVLAPARAFARECQETVRAEEGPFYPIEAIPETNDLIINTANVQGQILYLVGRVVDDDCKGVPDALLEIWQADTGGQYKHNRAPKIKPLDSNFRYFGKVQSHTDGTFSFRTIRPGPYRVFGINRAPHIHIRVTSAQSPPLTTEVYFAGATDDAMRLNDRVYMSRGTQKERMIAELMPASEFRSSLAWSAVPDALVCEYDLRV